MDQLQAYFNIFQAEFSRKIEEMYTSRFLRSIRFSSLGNDFFITARVSAEMKKNCIYTVDLHLDACGIVLAAQCECAVGMGPGAHCKHVCLALFALTKQQIGIITKETCTQTLQTFHVVKPYNGSPVKMQDLKLRRSRPLHELATFDPRPNRFRNSSQYPYYFRNVCLNARVQNIPIRQLYEPANLHALVNDHAYMPKELSFTEQCLAAMNITVISDTERENVERATRGQTEKRNWLDERCKRIQASNFGKICLAGEKTNFNAMAKSFTVKNDFTSKPTQHGRQYESIALKAYTVKSGKNVVKSGIQVCKAAPFLACSPDGLVEPDGCVEVKCPLHDFQ